MDDLPIPTIPTHLSIKWLCMTPLWLLGASLSPMTPCLSHFWLLTPQLTHSLTKHADWCAYSFLYSAHDSSSLCLLICAYPLLTDQLQSPCCSLQIPYKACFFFPFLFEILCFPHVYKAPGAQRSPDGILPSIAQNYPSLSLSLSVFLYSLSLIGFSEGPKASVFKCIQVYCSSSVSLGSDRV